MKSIHLLQKNELLKDLTNTWCKLASSGVHGVGVFAIRNIPKGAHPFAIGTDDWIDIEKEELKKLPKEVFELVKTYCLADGSTYALPKYGFKIWDMVVFLNHSKNPNIILKDGNTSIPKVLKF